MAILSKISALKLAGGAVGVILAGAALSFSVGYAVSQAQGFVVAIDQRGYERGVAEQELRHRIDAANVAETLRQEAAQRDREIDARIAASESRAIEAEAQRDAAVMELMNDESFRRCEEQALPDSARRHFPRHRVRIGAAAGTAAADAPGYRDAGQAPPERP